MCMPCPQGVVNPQGCTSSGSKRASYSSNKIQVEEAKAGFELRQMQEQAAIKIQLMEKEFQYNLELAKANAGAKKEIDKEKEDRKDERTKIQASQQSELINQRQNNSLPKSFESAGFDNLGGFGLEQFEPK